MLDTVLLIAAAFLAGIVNTIAGGGTFLTFPALLMVGVPPVIANATGAVAVLPGYLGGTLGFWRELTTIPRRWIYRFMVTGAVGGTIGALLLSVSTNRAFMIVVPFILLAGSLIFLFGESLNRRLARREHAFSPRLAGLLIVCIYGGYFNGGLGIVLLALFNLWGMRDVNVMNGLKNAMSLVLSSASVAAFAIAGLIDWKLASVMVIFATAGGYLGAPLARWIPASAVRVLVAAIGFSMSAFFLWKIW